MSGWWVTLLGGAGLWLLNRSIRHGLSAPRIREQGRPEGLPWREVSVPAQNGKRLFGWFIPVPGRGPALVIMHGWGGNAEMMLLLAAPLHEAGYSLLLVDARCHGRSDDDSFASLPRFAEDIESALDWPASRKSTPAASGSSAIQSAPARPCWRHRGAPAYALSSASRRSPIRRR